jgi:hypothetical protein
MVGSEAWPMTRPHRASSHHGEMGREGLALVHAERAGPPYLGVIWPRASAAPETRRHSQESAVLT